MYNNSSSTLEKARVYNWEDKVILVADDVRTNFLLIKAILNKTKAKILWAEDGEEAVEKCKTNKNIDLVLMDYQMPKITGYKAACKIKKIRNKLPVISQSANIIYEEEYENHKKVYDDCILKPIKVQNLLKVISKYI